MLHLLDRLATARSKLVATGTSDAHAFSGNVRLATTLWSDEHIKCPTRRRSLLDCRSDSVTRCCQTRDRKRVKACRWVMERSGGVAAYGTCAPSVLVGLGFPSRDGSFHHRDAIHRTYWQSEQSGLRHHRVPQLTSRRPRRANWALHHGFSCPSNLANLFATSASSRNLGVSQTCSKARKMGMTSWRHFKLRSTGETAGSSVSAVEKT